MSHESEMLPLSLMDLSSKYKCSCMIPGIRKGIPSWPFSISCPKLVTSLKCDWLITWLASTQQFSLDIFNGLFFLCIVYKIYSLLDWDLNLLIFSKIQSTIWDLVWLLRATKSWTKTNFFKENCALLFLSSENYIVLYLFIALTAWMTHL